MANPVDTRRALLTYRYTFRFRDGTTKSFEAKLDKNTLNLICAKKETSPRWAELKTQKCPICPLNESTNKYCPIAVNLEELIEFFRQFVSFDEVDVVIDTDERSYVKHTSVQKSLSSLLGIYMVTGGCPVMEKLKPMVRFHLPFASPEETQYRAISMYLFAQYFIYKGGGIPDWELNDLIKIYEEIKVVNKAFFNRLAVEQTKDANLNAVTILHNFANHLITAIDKDMLSHTRSLFSSYLANDTDGLSGFSTSKR